LKKRTRAGKPGRSDEGGEGREDLIVKDQAWRIILGISRKTQSKITHRDIKKGR